jgi:hypothetical protein
MKAHVVPAFKEKSFRKDKIFRKFFINFSTAFLGPQPLRHHIFPKAAAVVIKQFRKAGKKLYKNQPFYKGLSEIFLWLRNRFPKYIYPIRKILRNRFILFIKSFPNNFSLTAPKIPSLM